MNRRTLLRAGGLATAGALAGCAGVSGSRPAVDTNTGISADTRSWLDDTPVFLAGTAADLPTPPTTVDSLSAAEVALATPDASRAPLAEAFRDGTAVAFAGGGAPAALSALLGDVGDAYSYGTETVNGRPVRTVVAVPRDETAATFQFVREGGWGDPTLGPVGWALDARLPDCRTFVPERSNDDDFAPVGSAWVVGRLNSGETYAARTTASRLLDSRFDRVRFRTTLHAAAGGGYDVATVRRSADFANDRQLSTWFPNPHERDGIEVTNGSSSLDERLEVTFEPTNGRARAALTGCCGVTTGDAYGYDHRTRWTWTKDGLLGSDSRYGGGIGRGGGDLGD